MLLLEWMPFVIACSITLNIALLLKVWTWKGRALYASKWWSYHLNESAAKSAVVEHLEKTNEGYLQTIGEMEIEIQQLNERIDEEDSR